MLISFDVEVIFPETFVYPSNIVHINTIRCGNSLEFCF